MPAKERAAPHGGVGSAARITVPRVVVSSYRGKGGKTLATMAILAAFTGAGLRVSAFKNGPDFIDPGHHAAVLGSPSRNLDVVLMGDRVVERFHRYSRDSELAVIEGNHGLYDSADGLSEIGSTAQLAKLLHAPVLLVIDAERSNRTLGALVRGLRVFDPDVRCIAAIVTNAVPRQFDRVRAIVEQEGLPVVGILPRDEAIGAQMEYRHLGLVPIAEGAQGPPVVELIRSRFASRIDTGPLLKRIREANEPVPVRTRSAAPVSKHRPFRLGFLAGRPFTFYYPEMLERARELGSVAMIDPETDSALPPLDLLVIGGGFPEVYARTLERNRSLRAAVRSFVDGGGRVYAECGGLMYLTDAIVTREGRFEMVGAIHGETVQEVRPVAHGYARARVVRDTPFASRGTLLQGHEFHYSRVDLAEPYDLALAYEHGRGLSDGKDGIRVKNLYAHYLHLHPETLSVLDAILGTASVGRAPRAPPRTGGKEP